MTIEFATKAEAFSWVTVLARRGDSVFGKILYPILWLLVQLTMRSFGKATKVRGVSNMRVTGPVIYVSNHISNWDFPRIVMNTKRHMRPLYKIKAFENIFIRIFISFGGALPVAQSPKVGEKISKKERKTSVYLARATHEVFSNIIRDGGAGMVFAQGMRHSQGEPIGELNTALAPLFNNEEVDPLIVVVGLTSKAMVVRAGVRRSKMPRDKDQFLLDLQRRMQLAVNDAEAMIS